MKAAFRQMIALDIPLLVSMEREIYQVSPWSANQFKEELALMPKSREYLVALDELEIIGYGGVALLGDVAEIHTLTVRQSHRRLGIASTMLEKLESWALERGAKTLMLEMREGNSPAMSLYQRAGYQLISRRDNYYAKGIHALIMRKEVKL
ncbi:MAG: ribosomal-protein-alanine N-acetyltransferase [Actinobacteria bacterium]|nr:ribosomal-protein-alanine N-acetyltransferase [Actinomycetota bacterium]